MSDFVIEKDIPISTRCSPSKYPFAEMEVGDSFVSPLNGKRSGNAAARCAAYVWGKAHGRKFCTRSEGDMLRIWRFE